MPTEENKAVVGRWFTEFWGPEVNPAVIDEVAAPDIRFEYSLHALCRGRDEVCAFATEFRAVFPDLAFSGTTSLPSRLLDAGSESPDLREVADGQDGNWCRSA
ncbi:ester cyclase [Streptomyces sp. B3I7]|uniref:ester cyclase n=1 Tax=Streptomyces sp. B3I7 TaxID=3042269 RepID=UPI0027D8B274|nr:ester cyclase [Streptomyces sp. B3I7]